MRDCRVWAARGALATGRLRPVLGSSRLEAMLRAVGANIHVHGHSHINRDVVTNGVRYINNAFACPFEKHIAAKALRCIHATGCAGRDAVLASGVTVRCAAAAAPDSLRLEIAGLDDFGPGGRVGALAAAELFAAHEAHRQAHAGQAIVHVALRDHLG